MRELKIRPVSTLQDNSQLPDFRIVYNHSERMYTNPTNFLERILAISHKLISNHSVGEILQQIIQVAAELVDCEIISVLLLDEEAHHLRFLATTTFQDRLFNTVVPIDASIAGAAFAGSQAVIVNNVREDSRYYPIIAELVDYPAHSIVAVPLTFRDHKIGVLEAENKKNGQGFDATDLQLLTALATQATITIENARQVERYRQMQQAEQNQRQLADALRLASAAITSTLDYDQVIDRILEHVSQVIPSDTSNVMMIEPGNIARVFRGRGYANFGTDEMLNATTLKLDEVENLRRMCETRQPNVVPDITHDPAWIYSRPGLYEIRSYVGVPIIIRESVVGFLNLMSSTPNLYTPASAERLQAFANHAATALENARLYRQAQAEIAERLKAEEELRRHRDHLEELVRERTAEVHRLAITDSQTDLFNRRHLLDLGNQALIQSLRSRRPLSAMMIDIDHFKRINDNYGHTVGDAAIVKIAEQIRAETRAADILGRYGGEEFVVLMPETDLPAARQIAERLLAAIRTLQITAGDVQFGMTVSIGVVSAPMDRADQPPTIDALISLADQAMYAAKQGGRDRVVVRE